MSIFEILEWTKGGKKFVKKFPVEGQVKKKSSNKKCLRSQEMKSKWRCHFWELTKISKCYFQSFTKKNQRFFVNILIFRESCRYIIYLLSFSNQPAKSSSMRYFLNFIKLGWKKKKKRYFQIKRRERFLFFWSLISFQNYFSMFFHTQPPSFFQDHPKTFSKFHPYKSHSNNGFWVETATFSIN